MELAPPTLQDVKNLRATALDNFDKLIYRFCTLLCSKPQLDIMFSDKILQTLQPLCYSTLLMKMHIYSRGGENMRIGPPLTS